MISASLKWSRHRLFGSPFDTLMSIIVIPTILWLTYKTIAWALSVARWDIIPQSLRVLMIGIYPADQTWRAWAAFVIMSAALGAALGCVFAFRRYHAEFLALPLIGFIAVTGARDISSCLFLAITIVASLFGWILTSFVPSSRRLLLPISVLSLIAIFAVMAPPGIALWGGLLLSVLLTIVTAALSLPIGILLAFGRRSRLSSIRLICIAYIEVMRSVPLILVVYWIWILTPVLAPQWGLADVVRGMAGFTIFYSAYVAEYVRSGLQAVPRGQTEAARSIGMTEFDINRLIVLPQAFRVIVPPLVGNILDIFNAAPLVFIIGLTDFLRAGQMILADPQYGDRTYEVYSFLLFTYFLIGSMITYVARKIEIHMSRGNR